MADEAKPRVARATAKTGAKQLDPWKWKPGQSGNPKGRPPNAKQKLSDAFLADMLTAWEANGKAAIDRVIAERPHEFIKAVGAIVPKDISINREPVQELSDDELAAALATLRSIAALAEAGSRSEKASRH